MEIDFSVRAKEDIQFWKKSGNKQMQKKITELLKSIAKNPFEGVGKPEQLKHNLSGSWSRRLDQEHRIVYDVTNEIIQILSLRGHY